MYYTLKTNLDHHNENQEEIWNKQVIDFGL